jgi:hypothetical protein
MGSLANGFSKVLWTCIVAAALALGLGCSTLARFGPSHERTFSILALPDTQNYSTNHPEIFISQTEWIRDQKGPLHILCVVHEGDITNNNSDREWARADKAMSVLDGVVPYCIEVGNHDLGTSGTTDTRDSTRFNRYFPLTRFSNKPWFGGSFDLRTENAYYRFRAGGMKFLVVCLEFGPRDEVLDWANAVVAQHRKWRTIVVTHSYMYSDDTRVGEGDKWSPHTYPCKGNDGEEMWEKFVSRHPNIFLVLSGHILNDGLGRQTSVGVHGNRVHEVLANYQMKKNGGNGWLRILEFSPRENRIRVRTYSPWLKLYAFDDANYFDLDYRM